MQCNGILRARNGQVALSLTFLMGGIIVVVAATLAMIAISFLNASIGFQHSTSALTASSGGIQDAMLQISRNKNFSNSGYCIPEGAPPCADGSTKVVVTQNSPYTGMVTITAETTVVRYKRKVEAIVSTATSTGKSVLISWSLLTL